MPPKVNTKLVPDFAKIRFDGDWNLHCCMRVPSTCYDKKKNKLCGVDDKGHCLGCKKQRPCLEAIRTDGKQSSCANVAVINGYCTKCTRPRANDKYVKERRKLMRDDTQEDSADAIKTQESGQRREREQKHESSSDSASDSSSDSSSTSDKKKKKKKSNKRKSNNKEDDNKDDDNKVDEDNSTHRNTINQAKREKLDKNIDLLRQKQQTLELLRDSQRLATFVVQSKSASTTPTKDNQKFTTLGAVAANSEFGTIIKNNSSTFYHFFVGLFPAPEDGAQAAKDENHRRWTFLSANNYEQLHYMIENVDALKHFPMVYCTCGAHYFLRMDDSNLQKNRDHHFQNCDGTPRPAPAPVEPTPAKSSSASQQTSLNRVKATPDPVLEAAIVTGIIRSGISINAAKIFLSELWAADPARHAYLVSFLNDPYPKVKEQTLVYTNRLIKHMTETIKQHDFVHLCFDGGSEPHSKKHLLIITLHYPGGCFILRPQEVPKPDAQSMHLAVKNALDEVGCSPDKVMFCVVDGCSVNTSTMQLLQDAAAEYSEHVQTMVKDKTLVDPATAASMYFDEDRDELDDDDAEKEVARDPKYLHDAARKGTPLALEAFCVGHWASLIFKWTMNKKGKTHFKHATEFTTGFQQSFFQSIIRYHKFLTIVRKKIHESNTRQSDLDDEKQLLDQISQIIDKYDTQELNFDSFWDFFEKKVLPEVEGFILKFVNKRGYDSDDPVSVQDVLEYAETLVDSSPQQNDSVQNQDDSDDEEQPDSATPRATNNHKTNLIAKLVLTVAPKIIDKLKDVAPQKTLLGSTTLAKTDLQQHIRGLQTSLLLKAATLQMSADQTSRNANAPIFTNATRWARKNMGSFLFVLQHWDAVVDYAVHCTKGKTQSQIPESIKKLLELAANNSRVVQDELMLYVICFEPVQRFLCQFSDYINEPRAHLVFKEFTLMKSQLQRLIDGQDLDPNSSDEFAVFKRENKLKIKEVCEVILESCSRAKFLDYKTGRDEDLVKAQYDIFEFIYLMHPSNLCSAIKSTSSSGAASGLIARLQNPRSAPNTPLGTQQQNPQAAEENIFFSRDPTKTNFEMLSAGLDVLRKKRLGNRLSNQATSIVDQFKSLKTAAESSNDFAALLTEWSATSSSANPVPFWERVAEIKPDCRSLCNFMIALANLPPCVTACDSFISILNSVAANPRRANSHSIVDLAYLKANGDFTHNNPYVNWSAFDRMSFRDRLQEKRQEGITDEKKKK